MPDMATLSIEVTGEIVGWVAHRSMDDNASMADFESLPEALEYIITHGLASCSLDAVVEVSVLGLKRRVNMAISKDLMRTFARSAWTTE